jgi:DNA polymerase-1
MLYLLIDVPAIAYSSYFAMHGLSHDGDDTSAIFGVFKMLRRLQDSHPDGHPIFCFDVGHGLRKKMNKHYKLKATYDLEDKTDAINRAELHRQLDELRLSYLHAAGYKNVFYQEGYEADDIIASLCNTLDGHALIVSRDHDLWQLLRRNVRMLDPHTGKIKTSKDFREEWGLHPSKWASVKAIAGCKSDNVLGIHGIGERTAANYVAGKKLSAAREKLLNEHGERMLNQNLPLVKLPLPGVKRFTVRVDDVSTKKWNHVMRALGMASLKL